MEETNKEKLERLLKKSTSEITHEEFMFVIEHMDMQSLLDQASERMKNDLVTIKDEQNN